MGWAARTATSAASRTWFADARRRRSSLLGATLRQLRTKSETPSERVDLMMGRGNTGPV